MTGVNFIGRKLTTFHCLVIYDCSQTRDTKDSMLHQQSSIYSNIKFTDNYMQENTMNLVKAEEKNGEWDKDLMRNQEVQHLV